MISIVVPTRNGELYLRECLNAIQAQEIGEEVEVIVIDSGSTDGTVSIARELATRVHEIPPAEFNHGGTRNLGVTLAQGEIIAFTVQDATPAEPDWLARLVEPLREEDGPVATFSRQLPRGNAPARQRHYIEYRYGPEPRIQRAHDVNDLTMRMTFSNVSSAFRGRWIREQPFLDNLVVDEDGEWCARMLLLGHTVAYVPGSMVLHSHDYSPVQVFRRYFDLGVSSKRTFLAAGRGNARDARREGIGFVGRELAELWAGGHRRQIPATVVHEATRYTGFVAGLHHRYIPRRLRRRCSATPSYWA